MLLDGPYGVQRGVLRNLSERGAFVETGDRYPLGAQIKVVFSLPGSFVEIVALGEVRHVGGPDEEPIRLRSTLPAPPAPAPTVQVGDEEDSLGMLRGAPPISNVPPIRPGGRVGIGILFTGFLRNADELSTLPGKLRDLPM